MMDAPVYLLKFEYKAGFLLQEAHPGMMTPGPVLVLWALTVLATVAGQEYDNRMESHIDRSIPWIHTFRQGFNFQCPHGEVLVALQSVFSEKEGSDRLWTFECQQTPTTLGHPSECWWDDTNRAGMEWSSTCSNNGLVAGVMSKYFEAVLDREWSFYCCRYSRRCPYSCWKSLEVPEQYQEEGEFVIPSYGYFIRGAQTTFDGVLRDRQWKYIVCRMTDFDCEFENL
ncbi:hypothetical protein UPYG_G00040240 [Umbra pygmaea]|uniref:Dermatopontin n=1 Tax=Umbra pygmaea TaxID=75934 RepID=A0ABD0Y8J5_UMBPY